MTNDMSDVGFFGGRGFMRAGLVFQNPDGTFNVHYSHPRKGAQWSADGLRRYGQVREMIAHALYRAEAQGIGKLVLDGVDVRLVKVGDDRAGWTLATERGAAIDVLTARALLDAEVS